MSTENASRGLVSKTSLKIFIVKQKIRLTTFIFLAIKNILYPKGVKSEELLKIPSRDIPILSRSGFSLLRTTQEGTFGVCYHAEYLRNGQKSHTLIKTFEMNKTEGSDFH